MAAQLGSSTRRLCAGSRRIGDGHRSCGSGAPLGASEHCATGRISAGCDRRLASPPGGEPTRPFLPSHRYRARRSQGSATFVPPPGELRAIAPPPSPLALFVRSCAPIHPTAHIPTTPNPNERAKYLELTVTPCVRRRCTAAARVAARPLPSLPVQSPLHITADVGLDGRRATPTRPAAGFDSRRSVRWQLRCERRALAPACEVDVDPKVGSASTQRRATGRKVPNLTLGATKIVDAYCPSGCVCYL